MSANLVREVSAKEKDIDALQEVLQSRQPCLISGVDIGPAQSLWTAEYLATKCGAREVKVHVCPREHMDFLNKNFVYK